MKKIAIIGGGFTGCLSALFFAEKGHEVVIYEKNNFLGGIINDLEIDGNFYFNGPNYLNVNSWWFKKLIKDELFKNKFSNFKLKYGSYNDLFGEKIISNNFAQIVTKKKFEKINNKNFNLYNKRISCYQSNVFLPIQEWSKKFCKDYTKLHEESALIMNTGRVFFKNNVREISKLKKKNSLANQILGLPDLSNFEIDYCLPSQGYRSFFESLKEYLIKKKINIYLESRISIDKENKFVLLNKKKKIDCDCAIWCANPVELIKKTASDDLDNPVVKVVSAVFDITLKNNFSGNLYVQVFSKTRNLFRIFIYKLKNKIKMSLEIIHNKNCDISKENKFAMQILKKMGYSILESNYITERKEVRHILFTDSDLKRFKSFEKKQYKLNIFSGAWYKLGRENKLKYITENLEKYI